MYWTKLLHELYSNSRVLVHYSSKGHFFPSLCLSIIGCHNCSYSAILILNSFLYLQIQLYDTFSLSPSCALELCYRIKNISFMVFIKQLKPRIFVQCKYYSTDWSLAF